MSFVASLVPRRFPVVLWFGKVDGAEAFDVTDVGDAFTEMVNEPANLSLYDCMLGQTIHSFVGNHAAGGSFVRVRNTQTNRVKMLESLDVHDEQQVRPVETPFVVEQDDIIECFHVVVPT